MVGLNDSMGTWLRIRAGAVEIGVAETAETVLAHAREPVLVEHWPGAGAEELPPVRRSTAYSSWQDAGDSLIAHACLQVGAAEVHVVDRWQLVHDVFRVERQVTVRGSAPGGFLTELSLALPAASTCADAEVFVPGMQYGDPQRVSAVGIGGARWLSRGATRFWIREDRLPAPLVAVRLATGDTVSLLDTEPDGRTTTEDASDVEGGVIVAQGLRVGALGMTTDGDALRFGHAFPGSEGEVGYRGDTFPDGQFHGWRRRYHPVRDGLATRRVLEVRVRAGETFVELMRQSWRWAWQRLGPAVSDQDIPSARAALFGQLASSVVGDGDRMGVSHVLDPTSGEPRHPDRPPRAMMGFTGRNTDCGWYLVRESGRVGGEIGARYHRLGAGILDSFARLPACPPEGEGFELRSGRVVAARPHGQRSDVMRLRGLAEGGKSMVKAWHFERRHGRDHPAWLTWCTALARWMLAQQRADGSLPRSWLLGTDEVAEESGYSTYNGVTFFAEMYRATGEHRYLDAAVRGGEYCWVSAGHCDGVFVGGTLDNPDVVDKEAGTLSLEAYLRLYEETGDSRWLARAERAADFAQTWVYLWDVPMPDGDDRDRDWKNGLPTTGVQLIATGHSLVDQYMAFDAGSYAKLFSYTGDSHYRDVARLLLHNTKHMLALPGRQFDLAGPGWQQEHWSLAPPRGKGIHRNWLPWVTCSHIEGIVSIEDHDPALLAELSDRSDREQAY